MPFDDHGQPSGSNRPEVDVTLIDEMLRLSPEERLRQNDRALALAAELREAFVAHTDGQRR